VLAKKNSQLFKRHLLFVFLIAGFQLSVFAAPQVQFERFWDDEPGGAESSNPNPRGSNGVFKRNLNKNKSDLLDYQFKNINHKGIPLLTDQYKEPIGGFKITYRYFYTLNPNNQVNGYLLLEPVPVYNDENFPVSPIRLMKQLPENPTFLAGLNLPPQLDIKVYEQKSAGFVERYVFIKAPNIEFEAFRHLLLVDAYYPEALEQKFSQDTKKYLERFVQEAAVFYGS